MNKRIPVIDMTLIKSLIELDKWLKEKSFIYRDENSWWNRATFT